MSGRHSAFWRSCWLITPWPGSTRRSMSLLAAKGVDPVPGLDPGTQVFSRSPQDRNAAPPTTYSTSYRTFGPQAAPQASRVPIEGAAGIRYVLRHPACRLDQLASKYRHGVRLAGS